MKNIVKILEEAFPEKNMAMLDLFCGDGNSVTRQFAPLCRHLFGIDHDPAHRPSYCRNLGDADGGFLAADCVELIRHLEDEENPIAGTVFNLVGADSPQGLYGNGYCEHFDFIWELPRLLARPGFLLFNVNVQPFVPTPEATNNVIESMKPEDFEVWMERREMFYGRNPCKIGLNWMISFYERQFGYFGWPFRFVCHHMRRSALAEHPDHIAYLLFRKG